MKSKANFRNHPLHPILVGFPIAFFAGTLFFDVLTLIQPDNHFERTAFYLNIAGIATGLLAAVPGIIDYRYTVPPDSSAKKRGLKHGLINTFVIILFAVAVIFRINGLENKLIIGIEILGIIGLTIAGWLGGTLVVRNQIGIDIRYAGAGKWNEVYIDSDEKIIPVATTDELKANQMKLIHLNGKRIVVARGDNDIYSAFDDRCSHRGGSLAAGTLICNTVQCPWHGSQFDIQSGSVVAGPADDGIKVYQLIVKENVIYIENFD
jgi:nitrite reductase/ring-hydroxylating ferredoxin subunit/uncharacterized membrane protein